jgi:hypothetical protein
VLEQHLPGYLPYQIFLLRVLAYSVKHFRRWTKFLYEPGSYEPRVLDDVKHWPHAELPFEECSVLTSCGIQSAPASFAFEVLSLLMGYKDL